MRKRVPIRIATETWLAAVAAALGLLTLVWKDWIEVVLRVDPDHGDGSSEWWAVVALFGLAFASFVLSRWELRRLHAARTS